MYFRVVKHPHDSDIVVKTCKAMDGTTTIEDPAVCIHFDLIKNPSKHELPNGFVLSELNENHAEQLIQDRNFGCPRLNLLFYRYILKNYPSAAVVEQGSTVPVAYIAYRPEGCLALGYTNPNYRGRGFLKVVVHEMLRKLKQLGFTHTCGYAAANNYPSVKGMLAAGGVIVENYQPDFIQYIPRHWTEDQCLSRFQA
ncbi:hypothetical protein RvY_06552 [Ramazzottius varieornatus]|uniref:Glycine N-acyltransferase-like protein n=1 Tax=Ramazzottius varieornatus TaxID=947166 RepID=A0A1D1UZ11_RAMVA|nr:hypothetical protein RvY_06552 [Ramazzottius varieornatus]